MHFWLTMRHMEFLSTMGSQHTENYLVSSSIETNVDLWESKPKYQTRSTNIFTESVTFVADVSSKKYCTKNEWILIMAKMNCSSHLSILTLVFLLCHYQTYACKPLVAKAAIKTCDISSVIGPSLPTFTFPVPVQQNWTYDNYHIYPN